ncbi:MAG: hypothetical protein ERJ67_06735 [Aphanocapsa feldmannii 277cV]|uniref:Uncharacterized protein n=1 Tax=Aphanocapsa feldmannii 277cV TaxID=2507553 RepID=A0A524RNZ9_9CHRO|nr:MAG: hypothetical protein ERJ67_06735 [Aphanocapsa feldmannii 277cV]
MASLWNNCVMKLLDESSRLGHDYESYLEKVAIENKNLQAELSKRNEELKETKHDSQEKGYRIKCLEEKLSAARDGSGSTFNLNQLLQFAINKQPSVLDCIKVIEELYADRCTILESARSSAGELKEFRDARHLLDLLVRLVTTYRDRLMCGGDSEARKVFGRNQYAAKESETVMSNKAMRNLRTFNYHGKKVEMFHHLKIGVEEDSKKTIRVHFYWDANHHKIVIGHCGKHLPVPSH